MAYLYKCFWYTVECPNCEGTKTLYLPILLEKPYDFKCIACDKQMKLELTSFERTWLLEKLSLAQKLEEDLNSERIHRLRKILYEYNN